MKRQTVLGCVLVTHLLGPALLGQDFNPYAPTQNDPRLRRAAREQAVAFVGPVARALVEAHGDDAVAALFACSKPVGKAMSEFHASGQLDQLPMPKALLRAIARPGHADDVARWALEHARELADVDHFQAYLQQPLEYALGLKQLAAGAAEARASRLQAQAMQAAPRDLGATNPKFLMVAAGAIILAALLLWWRTRSRRRFRDGSLPALR